MDLNFSLRGKSTGAVAAVFHSLEENSHMDRKRVEIDMIAYLGALIILVLLCLVAGCRGESAKQFVGETQSMTRKSAREARPMLDPGTFTVDFSEERLTVVSNRAPRLSVIKRVHYRLDSNCSPVTSNRRI